VRWFRRAARQGTPPAGGARPAGNDDQAQLTLSDIDAEVEFVCATCGRTDLPPAGDWDPPICHECNEEVNFAAIEEVEITQDW
jgi:hypothetical protein